MDANDKNISVYVIYADTEKDLYYDSGFENEVPAEDCLNLFIKGVVCLYSGTYYRAVSCSDAGVIDFGLPT